MKTFDYSSPMDRRKTYRLTPLASYAGSAAQTPRSGSRHAVSDLSPRSRQSAQDFDVDDDLDVDALLNELSSRTNKIQPPPTPRRAAKYDSFVRAQQEKAKTSLKMKKALKPVASARFTPRPKGKHGLAKSSTTLAGTMSFGIICLR